MLLWQSEIFEIAGDNLQEINLVVFLELRKNREWHILKEHCACSNSTSRVAFRGQMCDGKFLEQEN
jgi:predicted nucleic acid-binding Zn finger protein